MYGNSWSRELCMGTVGVGSSVWEQLERGAGYGNSRIRVQCMGTVGAGSSVWEQLE